MYGQRKHPRFSGLFQLNGIVFTTICVLLGLSCGAFSLALLALLVYLSRGNSIEQPNPILPLLSILACLIATFCPPLALLYVRLGLRTEGAKRLEIEPRISSGKELYFEKDSDQATHSSEFDFRSIIVNANEPSPDVATGSWLRFAAIALAALVLVGAAGGGAYYLASNPENGPDFADWHVAIREASPAGYRAFLQLWPSSRYATEAERRLQLLDRTSEETAWNDASGNSTKDAYESYLRHFPTGSHAPAAISAIQGFTASHPLSTDAEQQLKPLETFRECVDCPVMVVVPSGGFLMGSSDSDIAEHRAYANEGPQHMVTISQPFALGKYEVTFAEWDACVADNGCRGYRAGDQGWGRGTRPVMNVSWDDAKLYARWLSQKTGKTYRLASEAEWEYAARAGSSGRFFFGNDSKTLCKYANVADEAGSQNIRGPGGFVTWELCNDGYANTAPVGSFAPNRFGLYDMLGNVSEWVEDVWHDNYEGAPADGSPWLSGGNTQLRIARGGSFANLEDGVRCAVRFSYQAGSQGPLAGFRIARSLAE